MCGIVGFIDKKSLRKDVLKSMMDKIIHRGPDGSGMYLDDTIALGHRRLSIIDIEGGTQPMKNEDGNLVCVFNGEIYNYKELRKELEEKGHVFVSESDTEVLLHGYEEWKKALLNKLRGMFAFVIWDKRKQELFCARDYFGIKPFYYYKKDDVFLFGSEIKSFLPHPRFEKKLNREQLDLYLTYQYSPGENTFFENVFKLAPAHFMIWREDEIQIARYWSPRFVAENLNMDEDMESDKAAVFHVMKEMGVENSPRTRAEWQMEINRVMQNSVKVHEISDVEVGSFLSSGIDSSLLVSLSNVDKTFTISFDNEKYDEASYAQAFSQSMGVWNKTCNITPEEFWMHLPKIQYYMDEPLADASCVALYFLNREAAKHVKVCLSGEGADELFAGYNIYKEPFMCEVYDRIPRFIRRAIGIVAEWLPSVSGINFLVRHSRNMSERYIGNTSLYTEKEKRKILKVYSGKKKPIDISQPIFKKQIKADTVTRMQFTDLHLWLVGDILLKADKMSMANSVELRVPFLDKEVFAIASKIPTRYRVNGRETKIALRGAAAHHIGEQNAKREKLGFPVPIRDWLREEVYVSQVRKCFESEPAKQFFDIDVLKKLLEEHASGKRDHWRKIWCVYMFLLWYEVYFC